jgi:hypothetical protein
MRACNFLVFQLGLGFELATIMPVGVFCADLSVLTYRVYANALLDRCQATVPPTYRETRLFRIQSGCDAEEQCLMMAGTG